MLLTGALGMLNFRATTYALLGLHSEVTNSDSRKSSIALITVAFAPRVLGCNSYHLQPLLSRSTCFGYARSTVTKK